MQFLSDTSHVLSTPKPHVASICHIGECRFPSSQRIPLPPKVWSVNQQLQHHWELVRNANLSPCPAYRFRIWILTKWNKISRVSLKFVKHCSEAYILLVHCLVKAMVFPVVMYGCESWTVKKAEPQRIDVFELWKRSSSRLYIVTLFI